MQRTILKSKLHRLTVTDSNLDYEGSVAIDKTLMNTAGMVPFEKVQIYNITNGNRFETYAIEGEVGSGEICINGAAAHLAKKGDIVIIATYGIYDESEALSHSPVLVYVDEANSVVRIGKKIAKVV
ncbi:MAG: aspartate 1-decarboxylase [Deltaproteobacteria bacterium]|nr:aspartate 1-decarboxylase [Deltaproteobacteria bacterium]